MKAFLSVGAILYALFTLSCHRGITIMSYNVENLFDDMDDGTEFTEFDPGRGVWNTDFFKSRIQSIADVVKKAVPGGPDILVLQEVENENALRGLAETGLKGMGYTQAVAVSKKGLPATTAILSRLRVVRVHSYAVAPWNGNPLRDVIEVEIEKEGRTLHLFNNHWKSKLGGSRETEASRLESSQALGRRVREILSLAPDADIVIAGDMNESVDEYTQTGKQYQTALIPAGERVPENYLLASLFLAGSIRQIGLEKGRLILFDPWFELPPDKRGSYVYQGDWLTVDHLILSPGMFDSRGFAYRWGSFTVVRLPFMLASDGTPKRWSGMKGERGYSDHLPLLISLDLRS